MRKDEVLRRIVEEIYFNVKKLKGMNSILKRGRKEIESEGSGAFRLSFFNLHK